MKILLVDDARFERMQLTIRLEQQGHTVTALSSGKNIMSTIYEFEPELVLLDINMPDVNGFEVAQQIRLSNLDWIPIVFLSGHDEPEMVAKAIESGGDDYLVKPVEQLVLLAKLKAMQRIALMRKELKNTTRELGELNSQLSEKANLDGLTSVFNRRFIDGKLDDFIAFHGRHNLPFTLILLDVDHFKRFNDTFGHLEGDHCLIDIAHCLKRMFTRQEEYVARYGGEEFVILIANCDEQEAIKQATRVGNSIRQLSQDTSGSVNNNAKLVTVSQGVLSCVPKGSDSIASFYDAADKALYQAKDQGRDQFVVAKLKSELSV